jgi:DNA-binding NarL/FixJ family response regulator
VPIDIILADDHAVVRNGIKSVLEAEDIDVRVIGEASNGTEVLALAEEKQADIYILDISMPYLNGIETAEKLIRKNPKTKVIILSMHDNRTFVERAFRCGVKGYILKQSVTDEIVQAVNEVKKGGVYISPKVSKYLVESLNTRGGKKIVALTLKEKEVLQLIAEGMTEKEIAKKLKMSPNTVHVHRTNMMKKLHIHKQTELVHYAIKEGICNIE